MKFLLMIQADEAVAAQASEQEIAAIMAAVEAIDAEFTAEGHKVGRVRLQPSATARTVRLRGSKRAVTDGPFGDTKEQLGGFWIVEAADGDEATALAMRLPLVPYASVEVRPVLGIDLPVTVDAW